MSDTSCSSTGKFSDYPFQMTSLRASYCKKHVGFYLRVLFVLYLPRYFLSIRYRNQRFKEKDKAKALSQNTDFIHVCPLCNETFNNGVLYGIHYPMCAESSGKLLEGRSATYCVSCPYCLTEFDSSQSFLRHYFDCRKENAYLCDYCQEFISNTHKTNHQQSCTQDVLCDNCGLSFSNR